MKIRAASALVLVSGAAASATAGTCSLCRETLASGGSGLIRGFYLSIILIVSISLIFLGGLARYLWRAYRPGVLSR
jgi:ABC-type thiamin/hydroxymethylpyrimidine transport system permease subunit